MPASYDVAQVPNKRCLMCKLLIGNKEWREVKTLARFGQMMFEHVTCPEKVLFLDIDGVCNSGEWAKAGNSLWHGTDPKAVALVRQIIEQTGCKVVLSSTWRLYPEAREVVRRDVCEFIDCTKDMQAGYKRGIVPRGNEVAEWLSRHPEIEKYAILDDDSDFDETQPLFKTTFEVGITREIAEAVIAHLNN